MASVTPEQIGREAGKAIADAIADGIENVILKLADNIARLSAEQDKQRDEIKALSNRLEGLTRTFNDRTDHLA
jgi:ABC-type transporter Mla subunit MlaD